MFDSTDLPANITRDYKLVSDYAREAVTVIDPKLRPKSFHFHIPHRHKIAGAPIWDREHWGWFDSLPRSMRDMINEDPGNIDDNLQAALAMWQDMITQAEKAMDRIIGYEKAVSHWGLQLPDWLTTNKTAELPMIEKLKAEREAEAARLAAERKEAEAEAERRRAEHMDRERRFGGNYRTITANDRTPLNRVELLDTRGMPPHLARELLAASTPLRFETRHYWTPPVIRKPTEADADKADRTPPAKVHPEHFKRGRNF